tara:strand:+ start:154 stop:672 length:519 start_codon:yes stop_codon:yes gene_type:complete
VTDIDEILEDIKNQIENLTIQDVILILVVALVLLYFILTKTQRGREVRKKFRILPRLIPLDDDYDTDIDEPENLDGSNRQLKGEIIDNEHDILNQLLRQEGTEELSGFENEDAVPAEEQDQNIPLANQNFNSMSGQIKSISDEQEFCAECKKPVKNEWKACPFCGVFLEIKD